MKEITVKATIDNYNEVVGFVEGFLEEKECPIKVSTQIAIAIDEIYSNVTQYAYQDGAIGDVTVELDLIDSPKAVFIRFTDMGVEYNPLEKEDPDVSLSVEERPIGGLGIFIVKKTMDDIKYEYKDNKNILTMIKNLE